jgi:hypothetical protein
MKKKIVDEIIDKEEVLHPSNFIFLTKNHAFTFEPNNVVLVRRDETDNRCKETLLEVIQAKKKCQAARTYYVSVAIMLKTILGDPKYLYFKQSDLPILNEAKEALGLLNEVYQEQYQGVVTLGKALRNKHRRIVPEKEE